MKKYIFLLISGLFAWGWQVFAQQIPISSFFVENPFLFNPAVAGSDDGFKIRMDNRFQWMGFEDAPITNILSTYGPHKTRNIGYGGTLGYDVTGPMSKFMMNGAFAYNFAVTQDIRLSLGLGLGFLQYRADGVQFELDADDSPKVLDPYAPATVMPSFQPDASAGAYLYHPRWYFGFSTQQLFNNNLKFNGENSKKNRLKTHFYTFGGYRFVINNDWSVEPALLLTKVAAVPMQMDLTGKAIYMQQFWGGVNIRNTFGAFNDITVLLGYIHEQRIQIGLAYDYTLGSIGRHNTGTIELTLGYNFDVIREKK
jgi:type IX secretion system PorP/SprF family membrane protein